MADLTPRTRSESFLNGEDLEPITRREHFYAGRENELPEGHQEPETREEWFIQKYRGGDGDVTVVPLSVTDNGTYSEEGKAYSPVSVNVPLPQDAYLLKSVANLPQAIASFNDGEEMVMPSLKVAIEPQQEGSGDPSPTNIRPISGWDEVDLTVADDVETPTVSNVYTIDLDGTRYGGKVDLVSGVMTVDRKTYTLTGSESWRALGTGFGTGTGLSGIGTFDQNKNIAICSHFTKFNAYDWNISNGYFNIADKFIAIRDDTNFDSVEDCVSYVTAQYNNNTPITICAKLATPLTIQLTPTAIKSLRGVNNVYANTGDIKDAEYFSKEV